MVRRRMLSLVGLAGLVAVAACALGRPGAVRQPTLRVLVLNMHAGADAGGRDNLPRVAALVTQTGADLVLLQEVDVGVERSRRVDQPAVLARETGRVAAFGKTLDYQGGRYGIAVLARWPIRRDTLVHLAVEPVQSRAGGSTEPRGALVVTLDAPAGAVTVVNTHLDPSTDDRYRRQEAAQVVALVAGPLGAAGGAVLVGGDFNSEPASAVQQLLRAGGLRDAWPGCGVGDGLTYPQDVPRKRIDYLYLTGAARCVHAEVLSSDASDHRGVLFEIRLR